MNVKKCKCHFIVFLLSFIQFKYSFIIKFFIFILKNLNMYLLITIFYYGIFQYKIIKWNKLNIMDIF